MNNLIWKKHPHGDEWMAKGEGSFRFWIFRSYDNDLHLRIDWDGGMTIECEYETLEQNQQVCETFNNALISIKNS